MRRAVGGLIHAQSRVVLRFRVPTTQLQCLRITRGKHNRKRTGGLFEDLFPERAKDEAAKARLSRLKANRLANITHDTDWWVTRADRPNIAGLGVVVVRHLSNTLDQDDFLRLVPAGKHLEGWAVTRGSIENIIAVRQLSNLKRDNVYVLLFASQSSALAYVARAQRIATITEMLGGPGSLSDRVLPRGLVEKGEDVRQLMESYCLAPPGQKLFMEVLPRPYSPVLAHLLSMGGSVDMVQRDVQSPAEVVIRTGLRPLSIHQLSRTIRDEEIARNLAWTSSGYSRVKLAIWRPTESEINYDRALRRPLHKDIHHTIARPQAGYGSYLGQPSLEEDSDAELLGLGTMYYGEEAEQNYGDEQAGQSEEEAQPIDGSLREGPGSGRVFVAGFATATEAKAFAQHFHRQWVDDPRATDGRKIQLDAEYLW